MLQRIGRTAARILPEPVLLRLARLRGREDRGRRKLRARARVVDRFDAHQVAAQTRAAVAAALHAGGIDHVIVPATESDRERIGVAERDRAAALAALRGGLSGPEWVIDSGRSTLHAYRVLAAPGGTLLADAGLGCEVDLWREVASAGVARADGGEYPPGTMIAPVPTRAPYLTPPVWREATTSATGWPAWASLPLLQAVRFPVDLVYTWVDGDDPQWLQRKAAYLDPAAAAELHDTAAHESRYRSHDELRYSLRSVAMYASWVRTIFVVTDGQTPAWLDTGHPQIRVVDHREIFTDPSVLPVFNSHAIESQLHHVPDLAEHYLYLNDDFFFGRPVRPELFFAGNGSSRFFESPNVLDVEPPGRSDTPVLSAAKRNRELIERRFAASVTHKFKHAPYPQRRDVLQRLEDEYPAIFAAVARSRFRHPDDVSVAAAWYAYMAYGLGGAVPGEIAYAYQDIAAPQAARRLAGLAASRHADVFCLNDHESDASGADDRAAMLHDFLDGYFPLPSPYERG